MDVKIDDSDVRILRVLSKLKKNEQITPYAIGRKVFPSASTDREKRNKAYCVISRLEKLKDYGLVAKTEKSYDLLEEKCWFAPLKVPHLSLHNAVFMKTKQGAIIMQTR